MGGPGETRKVSEGVWGFLKETVISGSSGLGEKREQGGPLTLEGLLAGECQASWFTNGCRRSGSAPESGEHREVPARWAGASEFRSCLSELLGSVWRRGPGALGSGCPQPEVQLAGGCAGPSVHRPATAEIRRGKEIPNKSTNSGLSAPACKPACLPNVTVKWCGKVSRVPPLTDLIGQSAEAGLPLGNSCKQSPSPPPPCLPPRLSRARSLFPAPSGRPTFRSWLPSTPCAPPPPEPRLKMRPSVPCPQPAEGQAPGGESWQTIKACGGSTRELPLPSLTWAPGLALPWKASQRPTAVFRGRKRARQSQGVRVGGLPRNSRSLLRTDWGAYQTAAYYSGATAWRWRGVVLWVEHIPSIPLLLLL